MQTAATTSHAALTASPRLSATMAKETAPRSATAIHKIIVWKVFFVADLFSGATLIDFPPGPAPTRVAHVSQACMHALLPCGSGIECAIRERHRPFRQSQGGGATGLTPRESEHLWRGAALLADPIKVDRLDQSKILADFRQQLARAVGLGHEIVAARGARLLLVAAQASDIRNECLLWSHFAQN
jgi:hypothetical protein